MISALRLPAMRKDTSAKDLSLHRADMEFLPAAIEILETPPCPVRTTFLLTICAASASALLLSYFGQIDVIASARGKIQPQDRVKVVQPIETGKVAKIFARNGQMLEKGEPLLELDTSDARADEEATLASLESYRAEVLRRREVLAAAKRPDLAIRPVAWPSDISAAARARQDRILAGEIGKLSAAVASFDARTRQKEAERHRYEQTIAAQRALLDVVKQRVDMRATLQKEGIGSKSNLIDAVENFRLQAANLTTSEGEMQEAIAGADVLQRDCAKAIETFIAENLEKLAEAEHQSDEFAQKLRKAHVRLDHMMLTSPVTGTVTGMTITALGQVVTVGEEVARVVPRDAPLEIEAYLENKDIAFVKAGQKAIVKIDSLPFTRYGTLSAVVSRIATDAIPEQDAQRIEGDSASASRAPGGSQHTENLVFPVILELPPASMSAAANRMPISPGMSVAVEIRTDRRRIIDYIFAPLSETATGALHER